MARNVEMVGFEPTCNQTTVSTLYKSEPIHLEARWMSNEIHLDHAKECIRKSLIQYSLKKARRLPSCRGGNQLRNPAILHYVCRLSRPNVTAGYLSQRRDSNPRISVLQTDALNHLATLTKNKKPRTNCPGLAAISINFLYHNISPRHVHTSCFWQPCE
jgi:hypothetical protein